MGFPSIIHAAAIALDQPIWRCPQVWVTPQYIDQVPGWSWKLDTPNPLQDDGPWRLGLDVFIGHHIAYESADGPVVWTIVKVNESGNALLCVWPD